MMAENSSDNKSNTTTSNDAQSSGNWWDTWISSAKSKSAEVYSMVKKDLDEIGTAVKSEASHVFSSTSNVIGKTLKLDVPESPANVMKKSFSTFIGQMSTVLNPEPDDDDDDTEVILSTGDTTMLSTYKKELEALQRLDATFIVPANSCEFDAWRASLESTEVGVISPSSAIRKLEGNPVLKGQYEKLVPDAVSHEEFWERYLFRVALLQDRLAAAARKQTAENMSNDPVLAHLPIQSEVAPKPVQEGPKKVLSGLDTEKLQDSPSDGNGDNVIVTWEEEDFAYDVELTEEQQILLLEEYEKEIASKKLTKQTSTLTENTVSKSTNTVQKKAKPEPRDKLNNKQTSNKINKQTTNKKNKEKNAPKKSPKADVCGNNLIEDYFGDKEVKDDASANSDESWEKEFEIEEGVYQKS